MRFKPCIFCICSQNSLGVTIGQFESKHSKLCSIFERSDSTPASSNGQIFSYIFTAAGIKKKKKRGRTRERESNILCFRKGVGKQDRGRETYTQRKGSGEE